MVELALGTFRSEDEDDYEYEFSVLSTRTSKNVSLESVSEPYAHAQYGKLVLVLVLVLRSNVPVKSKLQHPPPGNPRAFEFLEKFLFKFPTPEAEKLFKCPIIGPFQVIKCPHPRETFR